MSLWKPKQTVADANKASSEENSNGIIGVCELSPRTLVFTMAQIPGSRGEGGGLRLAAKYLWAIQLQRGDLL